MTLSQIRNRVQALQRKYAKELAVYESTEGGGRDGGAGYKGPRGATVPVDFGSLASVNGLRWSC